MSNAVATVGAEARRELIPLDRLMLSELNVRKTDRAAFTASLAEDIAAKGLKQNLVVVPVPDDVSGGNGWFEVVAGGRRFQAMKLLVADGRFDPDREIPCLIEARSEARETSLSENMQRVAMNPADEFEGYASILAEMEGTDAERHAAIARRFGVSVAHVEGRLRLAELAPEILAALRENKLTVAGAKAYAGVSDHKLQLKVFKAEEKRSWGTKHEARAVKEALRGATRAVDCAEMKYVGRETYVNAGGRIESEMFMGTDGNERVLDGTLLDKLVAEKGDVELPGLVKAAGYQSGLLGKGAGWQWRWPKAPKDFVQPGYNDDPSKAQKKKSIGVFKLKADGSGLELGGRFKPTSEPGKVYRGYQPPSPEEVAAQRRAEGIELLAARMACPKVAGTPLEGKAFWPSHGRWIEPIVVVSDDQIMVVQQLLITRAEWDAQREAAAIEYDVRLAAKEAEAARKAEEAEQPLGDVVGQIAALDEDEESIEDASQVEPA